MNGQSARQPFRKTYHLAIDTAPLPEDAQERLELVMRNLRPLLDDILRDAMQVAIGTWPEPESIASSTSRKREVDVVP